MERRIVITGMGVISSVGNNVNEFWDSIVSGKSGIDLVTHFDTTEFKTKMAGQVKNFDIEKYMSLKDARRLDRFCQFAIAAADEAMECAGLPKDLSTVNPERVGVNVSSGIGGLQTLEEQAATLREKGPKRVSPFLIPMMIIDLGAGNISMRYGAKGPNFSIVSACASAANAIGEAFWIIKRDDADIMITGGAEASITPVGFAGFCSMQAMSTRNATPTTASSPFDKNRDGFVMAEGAGVVILEELEHAKKRGANILAEVVGYGASADAHHITAPAPGATGAIQAVKSAIKRSGLSLSDIGYVNAHGTSTPLNDKQESIAYKAVFGDYVKTVNVSSTKGSTGHGLGASGGIETIVCVKAINESIVPPTINMVEQDPEIDINVTPNVAVSKKIKAALNVNLGFGGHNAALIIKKFE
ncbi:MAG TPA: beta-ketoacyl-[acyl-carrier-protein] synthase II [Lentisphaeria bacterium]|nr:MAG: beta-ketoacyl-[acyl-carrier-protein] synthase II [Lentisphaerae bacterium GWF2_38_69]HBM17495.1 beta-ketoacyl-[acyl-carrier-protein] synthase II [Lentisphaeria bacterium]